MNTRWDLTELTALIVASYVSNNTVRPQELANLVGSIHGALSTCRLNARKASCPGRAPAVPIEKSVTRDYLVCLEDGQRVKLLKRYLWRRFALTPKQYRTRWGLPADYPMVAPGYSELRASLAQRNEAQK